MIDAIRNAKNKLRPGKIGMTAKNPTAVGISSDFEGFDNRDTLQIGDVVYKIIDIQAIDDAAFSTLNLGRTT